MAFHHTGSGLKNAANCQDLLFNKRTNPEPSAIVASTCFKWEQQYTALQAKVLATCGSRAALEQYYIDEEKRGAQTSEREGI